MEYREVATSLTIDATPGLSQNLAPERMPAFLSQRHTSPWERSLGAGTAES
jgi:hypothetical protein